MTEEVISELIVLASIYGDNCYSMKELGPGDSRSVGQLYVQLNLSSPVSVYEDKAVSIDYLPPVIIKFSFPHSYPCCAEVSSSLDCYWLPKNQLKHMEHLLENTWEQNKEMSILYLWYECIGEEANRFLNVCQSIDLADICLSKVRPSSSGICNMRGRGRGRGRVRLRVKEIAPVGDSEFGECSSSGATEAVHAVSENIYTPKQLLNILLDYNTCAKKEDFRKSIYNCEVCLTAKKGGDCICFHPCNHVFCKDCIREYFEINIKEGDVSNVRCLAANCDIEATQDQVRESVSEECFNRYDELLFQRSLDTMTDVMFCPRIHCQSPVLLDDTSPTMATCAMCNFSFCIYCKRVYHGVAPCQLNLKDKLKLCEDYTTGDRETKELLEQRYGHRRMKQLAEDSLAEQWIEDNSKQCPHCRAFIEKSGGCNKMTCKKCGSYFCWICLARLHHKVPYGHFNNPESPCFKNLFDRLEDEEDNEDNWMFELAEDRRVR